MANLKAVVRRPRKDGFWQVYIRITHRRNVGFIKTDKMVTKKELTKENEIKDPYVLKYCADLIIRYNEVLNTKDTSEWDVNQVIQFLTTENEDVCFSEYAKVHIARMTARGQARNAKNYKLAVSSLKLHLGTNRVMFNQLTSMVVNKWIESLSSTRRAKEMYPVCIRQIFKAAVAEYNDYDLGIIRIKSNPWPKVKIPEADRSEKKAISAEACREFFAAPVPESKMSEPLAELGQDVAMLVFCLAGINTVDLYNMQKSDYSNGVIHYKRAKTKGHRRDEAYIEMRVEPVLLPLFDKYKTTKDDPYLFRFHKRFCDSDSFNANCNSGIKQLCKSMGMPKESRYCAYTFRHTWATIAQNDCGANIAEVGFAMNHTQGRGVTRGYIKIDFSPAWELNKRVIDFVLFSQEKSKLGMAVDIEQPKGKLFRISPKMQIEATAFFKGEKLVSFIDIGYSNIEQVIAKLASELPDTIPTRATVHFSIKKMDTGQEMVYPRTKGKGF